MQHDYSGMGLRIGLELHQQLNTRKLFCDCSTEMKESCRQFTIKRRLRPSAGEMGKLDMAAVFEFLRGREFEYNGYACEACLVDTDDEPPHSANEEALEMALGISILLGFTIPDEIHVMRKTVLDGSAITSFQRTMLVGYGSPKFGGVRLRSLCLEEDAARPEESGKKRVTYSLSRLGIPLVELATEPDISSPEQCLEIAQNLGLVFRSFNVKRGIGTIRQDVNVSISGGARVEIKGWQDLKNLPRLIRNEIARQQSLIEIKKRLENDGRRFGGSLEASEIFGFGCCIIRIPGMAEMSSKEMCEGRTLLTELSEYASAYGADVCVAEKWHDRACYEKAARFAGIEPGDLVLMVYGKDYRNAALTMEERARHLWKGVPEETRKPNPDGTSSFARPLPGSERMYPETDCMPITTGSRRIDAIRSGLPKTMLDKKSELEELVPKEIASQLIRSKYYPVFEEIAARGMGRETLMAMATTFTSTLKDMERNGTDITVFSKTDFLEIFSALEKKKITAKAVPDILASIASGSGAESSIAAFRQVDASQIGEVIEEVVKENPGRNTSALMGLVMARLGGKADGKMVMEMLRKKAGSDAEKGSR